MTNYICINGKKAELTEEQMADNLLENFEELYRR